MPFGILDTSIQVDLTPVSQNPHPAAPIQPYSYDRRNNIDGYLVFNSNPNGGSIGYTQVFRSGALESVDAGLLDQSNFPKQIASTHVEQTILEATRRYLQVVKLIGTSLPLLLMVTLFGLKGYVLATGSARPAYGSPPIDRDILLLPDVLLENFETPPDVLLKPIFDAFWQSAGYAACQHYDANGHWVPTNS